MEKIRRLLSILIIVMMTASPFVSFATEEGSFGAPESGSAADIADEGFDGSDPAAEAEDTEEAAPGSGETDAGSGDTAADSEAAAPETAEDPGRLEDEMTEVTFVSSVEELSEESDAAYGNDAFFTIDAARDDSAELATDEVSEDVTDILSGGGSASEKQDEIIGALEDSGLYRAEGSGKGKVEVTSKFAYQRLRLTAPRDKKINAYGAVSAVYFEGSYQLSYDSMEATMTAYEALAAEYGRDAVLIDSPMKINSSGSEKGWGTAFMGLSFQKTQAANRNPVTVAVIDTGIQKSHPVFSGKTILEGKDFVNNDDDPSDDNGHGTAVGGIIAESTPSNVKIMPLKALDAVGDGSLLDIINAVRYADNNGADIINMSIGGYLDYEEDMKYCEKLFSSYGAMIICASGNESRNLDDKGVMEIPGELSSTICVGAITTKKARSSFSNYGKAVDFAAPGSNVLAATRGGSYSTVSGTSFSTPYLTAAAAIVKAGHSDYSNKKIIRVLRCISEDLGEKGGDVHFGSGCPVFIESADYQRGRSIPIRGVTTAVSGVSNRVYDGTAQTQDPRVYAYGELLEQGTDYEIRYKNNVNAGKAEMTIYGKGDFSGELDADTFNIVPKQIIPAVRLSGSSFAWNGSERTPSVEVYDGSVRLPESQYSVSYPNGGVSVGTYSVSVTLRDNYSGQGTADYRIVPKGTKIKKLKGKSKALTVRWSRQSRRMSKGFISGYQVQVASDPGFSKKKKTVSIKGYKNTSNTVKKLAAGKKYYVRIRTYRTVGGKKYYSAWSGARTVRTK